MDKVLVLCMSEVRRRYGGSTQTFEDSVMIEAEFQDQVWERFHAHYRKLAAHDPWLLDWRMISYLPQSPLKPGKRTIH